MKNNIEIVHLLLSQPAIEIEARIFKGCKKLTEVSIPSSITSIPESAFYEFTSLKNNYSFQHQ